MQVRDRITEAAEVIVAEFNHARQRRLLTPTVEHIAEIIARALPPPAPVAKFREEWDALHAAMMSANAKCAALSGSGLTPEVEAAEDEVKEADQRLDQCAQRIAEEPVRTPADLVLLAEVVHWFACWPDGIDNIEQKAVLALLKGVRDMMRNSPGRRGELPSIAEAN